MSYWQMTLLLTCCNSPRHPVQKSHIKRSLMRNVDIQNCYLSTLEASDKRAALLCPSMNSVLKSVSFAVFLGKKSKLPPCRQQPRAQHDKTEQN